MATTDYDQLSLGDLGRRLVDTVSQLVEKQIELAKQELREDLQSNQRAAIWLGAGAALLLFAMVCLLIALTTITAHLFGWTNNYIWVAALIWLVIFAVAGGACLLKGKGQLQLKPLGLSRTTLKEDLEWARLRLKPPER